MRKRCSIQQGEKDNCWSEQSPKKSTVPGFLATRYICPRQGILSTFVSLNPGVLNGYTPPPPHTINQNCKHTFHRFLQLTFNFHYHMKIHDSAPPPPTCVMHGTPYRTTPTPPHTRNHYFVDRQLRARRALVITIQRCFVENQKGIITIDFVQW